MGRMAMPIFRRNDKNGNRLVYVAVRPIYANGRKIMPGEVVDKPTHILKMYHQRRRIGPEGHPWTLSVIGDKGFPKKFSKNAVKEPVKKRGRKSKAAKLPTGLGGNESRES